MEKQIGRTKLILKVGDITQEEVDAVVNAANSSLMGGGGVDGAIHRAGGPAILEECRKIRTSQHPGGLPAGEAVATTAGRLPAKYVIHTVGPVWHGGKSGEPETLARCYTRSLEEAEKLGLLSVAFPAISTGVYGYPRERAAAVAWRAVSAFLAAHARPHTVRMVFFSAPDMRVFLDAVKGDAYGKA